ncbi:MAG TPA: hypothetical protein VJA21_34135 [Verrucomicrobiae bacterium]
MKYGLAAIIVLSASLTCCPSGSAEVKAISEHKRNDETSPRFRFKEVPPPSSRDLATTAEFKLVDGKKDANAGGLEALHDGRLPRDEDQPADNFFFAAGTDGGRILIDLGRSTEVKHVNTYSWHPGTRGPQVYRLFGTEGKSDGFNPEPRRPLEPEKCGWKLLGTVDTRPKEGDPGGQYGVSLFDTAGNLGTFRYLLFDISRTEAEDPFGNTFFSEIDVLDPATPETAAAEPVAPAEQLPPELIETEGYQITLDASDTPDLAEWVHQKVGPMAKEWYPKLARMLASDAFVAPKKVSVIFDGRMRGVAATGGTRVRCAGGWFRENLQGEALGAVFHELVHVISGRGSRGAPRGARGADAAR